jgi:hypothetical protein
MNLSGFFDLHIQHIIREYFFLKGMKWADKHVSLEEWFSELPQLLVHFLKEVTLYVNE